MEYGIICHRMLFRDAFILGIQFHLRVQCAFLNYMYCILVAFNGSVDVGLKCIP